MTTILTTLGPSSLYMQTIHAMDREDVYLYRINMSHTAIDKLRNTIEFIQNSTSTPICIDSEGAQLRNNYMENDNVLFRLGSTINIHYSNIVGDCNNISFNHIKAPDLLSIGDEIGIDFYGAKVQVIESTKDCGQALVISEGVVGSNKAVTVNKKIPLPAITEKDIAAIQIAREMGVRNFAYSFANSKSNVIKFRELSGPKSNVISKIESVEGLMNLDGITKESDEILIDRGDLSKEVKIETIPFLQRKIIAHANAIGTPVFVATNLLESMTSNSEPNRAEVNDIVSTLRMGADGLVLAGETAIGKYPLECVRMLRRLIEQNGAWSPDKGIEDILDPRHLDT